MQPQSNISEIANNCFGFNLWIKLCKKESRYPVAGLRFYVALLVIYVKP